MHEIDIDRYRFPDISRYIESANVTIETINRLFLGPQEDPSAEVGPSYQLSVWSIPLVHARGRKSCRADGFVHTRRISVRAYGWFRHYRPFVFPTLLVSDNKFTCAASIATDDKEKIQAPAQICHFEHSVRSHYIDGTDSADTRIAAVYS